MKIPMTIDGFRVLQPLNAVEMTALLIHLGHGDKTIKVWTSSDDLMEVEHVARTDIPEDFLKMVEAQTSLSELLPLRLVPVEGKQSNTVNARDLHAFLGVKTRFNDWIRLRIAEFGFKEHRDFESYTNFSNAKNQQLTPAKEFAITLDMAKELAMVEPNEQGKMARTYFIECERQVRNRLRAPSRTPTSAEERFLFQAQLMVEAQHRKTGN